MKDILAEVKNLLDNNKEVLFSGTPCQIAGLKNYLKKDYCNLFTVDILCHGAPSAKVWMKYAEKISNGKIITSVNFRDKKQGSSPFLNITFSDKTE